jgi:hypothetical protein
LLGVIQFGGAARFFPEDVVDVAEGLLEHRLLGLRGLDREDSCHQGSCCRGKRGKRQGKQGVEGKEDGDAGEDGRIRTGMDGHGLYGRDGGPSDCPIVQVSDCPMVRWEGDAPACALGLRRAVGPWETMRSAVE